MLDEVAAIHSIGKAVLTVFLGLLRGGCQRGFGNVGLQRQVGADGAACGQVQAFAYKGVLQLTKAGAWALLTFQAQRVDGVGV